MVLCCDLLIFNKERSKWERTLCRSVAVLYTSPVDSLLCKILRFVCSQHVRYRWSAKNKALYSVDLACWEKGKKIQRVHGSLFSAGESLLYRMLIMGLNRIKQNKITACLESGWQCHLGIAVLFCLLLYCTALCSNINHVALAFTVVACSEINPN